MFYEVRYHLRKRIYCRAYTKSCTATILPVPDGYHTLLNKFILQKPCVWLWLTTRRIPGPFKHMRQLVNHDKQSCSNQRKKFVSQAALTLERAQQYSIWLTKAWTTAMEWRNPRDEPQSEFRKTKTRTLFNYHKRLSQWAPIYGG